MNIFAKIVQAIKFSPRGLPVPFDGRLPDEHLWRGGFGDDFARADRVLCIFCDAFMFDPEERYRFRPEDSIPEIYCAVYPSRNTPDCLEHLFLIEGLEKEFGFKFDDSRLEKIESFRQIVDEIRKHLEPPR